MTKHLLKNFHYKPLENYYETKYVSRLISDLLYTIMADALKDSYQLRPIADHEVDELLTEIDNCIQHVEQLISPISLELDKFPNYDDILIELEQLRNLLENYKKIHLLQIIILEKQMDLEMLLCRLLLVK